MEKVKIITGGNPEMLEEKVNKAIERYSPFKILFKVNDRGYYAILCYESVSSNTSDKGAK